MSLRTLKNSDTLGSSPYAPVAPRVSDPTGVADTAGLVSYVQDAIAAGGNGTVQLRSGTYYVINAALAQSGADLRGAGPDRTIFKLPDGATGDVLKSLNFDALVGQNKWVPADGVQQGFALRGFTVEGNRDAAPNGRYGLALYGKNYIVEDVHIDHTVSDGLYSEIGATQTTSDPPFEAIIRGFKSRRVGGTAMRLRGPTDMVLDDILISNPDEHGIAIEALSNVYNCNFDAGTIHIYSCGGVGLVAGGRFRAANLQIESCWGEALIENVSNCAAAELFVFGNWRGAGQTVSAVDAAANTITIIGHQFDRNPSAVGYQVRFASTGALPAPLTAGTTYYVIPVDANTIRVADTFAHAKVGTAIDLTTTGSGTIKTVAGNHVQVANNFRVATSKIVCDKGGIGLHFISSAFRSMWGNVEVDGAGTDGIGVDQEGAFCRAVGRVYSFSAGDGITGGIGVLTAPNAAANQNEMDFVTSACTMHWRDTNGGTQNNYTLRALTSASQTAWSAPTTLTDQSTLNHVDFNATGVGTNPSPVNTQRSTVRVYKSADGLPVNNSTTLQNDPELLFRVGANETWIGEIILYVVGDATADLKVNLTVPPGATLRTGLAAARLADAVMTSTGSVSGSDLTAGASATTSVVILKFSVKTGATAGTVRLVWAQSTAVSADTTVKAGSTLLALAV